MDILPLTTYTWPSFEILFGPKGACAGCWCMYPRLKAKEDRLGRGEINKARMLALVESGAQPGLIGFINNMPVGWVSLGPREAFPRLATSKIHAPIDDQKVWSVVCLYIEKSHRRQGVSVELLKVAGKCANARGATFLEGYPTDSSGRKQPDAWVWTGIDAAYIRAGFVEVARRSATRPIMRLNLR